MRIVQGTVVDGRIVVEDGTLKEGAQVAVVVSDDESAYRLTAEEEGELIAADAEIERGEYVTPAQLLADLERGRG